MNPLLRVKFGRDRAEHSLLPSVEHRHVRVITRRRVYLFAISWGNR